MAVPKSREHHPLKFDVMQQSQGFSVILDVHKRLRKRHIPKWIPWFWWINTDIKQSSNITLQQTMLIPMGSITLACSPSWLAMDQKFKPSGIRRDRETPRSKSFSRTFLLRKHISVAKHPIFVGYEILIQNSSTISSHL